jgi:multidrug resistance efflux pump
MWKRVLAIVLVGSVLVALLVHSQIQREPLKVSGFVEADEIRLGSRVGGRVAAVHCEEGQRVTAATVLISLQEFDLEERRAEAAAHLAAREAELERLKQGFRAEETAQAKARVDRLTAVLKKLKDGPRPEELQAAKARVELSIAQAERAKRTFDRVETLFSQSSGAVNREDMDRATEELKVAEKNKEVREQEWGLLKNGTRAEDITAGEAELEEARQAWQLFVNGSRKEDIRQAEAAVAAAKAVLQAVEAQLHELQVVSPVDGLIDAVELQPGDLVSAGAPVLSLLDLSRLWVRAYVPENRLDFPLNKEVRITADSFKNETFRGRISFISSQAEFTPNNVQTPDERSKQVFRIKVTLEGEARAKLRPGMPVDVLLEPPPNEAATSPPRS